jgi:membrane protein DedA with SNARE-associated domain
MADLITQLLGEYNYYAAFVVLFLCGLGLPIPEEVTLIGSGILLYLGKVEYLPITAVCSIAILLGDSVPYWIGRRWGPSALRLKWVSKVLHPERFARLQKKFEEHGQWATFSFRFFMGLRIPGYFMAGMMGMKYWRFALLDTLGILISVPISIYIGKLLGDQVDKLQATMKNFHFFLLFGVVLAVSLAVVWKMRARRALAGKTGPASQPPQPPQH